MSDHRRIQRTLFRMQLDPGFAARLRGRDPTAVASTGLTGDDLALLLKAPRAGVEADAGGRRRAQFLRNVSGEHALTVAHSAAAAPDLLESFTAGAAFHEAIARDLRLPLAFARHAVSVAAASGDALLLALALIEGAMARARRGGEARPGAAPGQLVLAPRADVLELPAGSVAAAGEIRSALDQGRSPRPAAPDARATEAVLVLGHERPHPHALGEATIEILSPLAGALLLLAREPLDTRGLAAFRREHDVEAGELEPFLQSLEAERILSRA